MQNIDISLFASSIREDLYPALFKSLETQDISWEVIFAGNNPPKETYPNLTYVLTGNIKPAQCYEVARRYCQGELVMWIADDCEFSPNLLKDVYNKWIELSEFQTIISVKTNEDGKENILDDHRFFGFNRNTPLMAPLGVINRAYLEELGGLDRRYICGQYENDIVMRSNQRGGRVVKFEEGVVNIDHLKKHGSGTKFWSEYDHDRTILENSWVIGGYDLPPSICIDIKTKRTFTPPANREVSLAQLDKFEPYTFTDKELMSKTESFKGQWE